jgi:hypothetical protein
VLLCGEGDFSFALALSAAPNCPTHITATSFDSYYELADRYKGSCMPDRLRLLQSRGVRVLHGVDATVLDHDDRLAGSPFTAIVFQFPHVHGRMKIKLNRTLLRGFMASASRLSEVERQQQPGGGAVVRVTLARGQGGTPADGSAVRAVEGNHWQVLEAAAAQGMVLQAAGPFDARAWAQRGYASKGYRAKGERGFLTDGGVTHDFTKEGRGVEGLFETSISHDIRMWSPSTSASASASASATHSGGGDDGGGGGGGQQRRRSGHGHDGRVVEASEAEAPAPAAALLHSLQPASIPASGPVSVSPSAAAIAAASVAPTAKRFSRRCGVCGTDSLPRAAFAEHMAGKKHRRRVALAEAEAGAMAALAAAVAADGAAPAAAAAGVAGVAGRCERGPAGAVVIGAPGGSPDTPGAVGGRFHATVASVLDGLTEEVGCKYTLSLLGAWRCPARGRTSLSFRVEYGSRGDVALSQERAAAIQFRLRRRLAASDLGFEVE